MNTCHQQKRKKLKYQIWILQLLLGMYLLFAGLSQLDTKIFGNTFSKYISFYKNSIFKQKWNMFAPYPLEYSIKIRFSCNSDEPWKYWIDEYKQRQMLLPSISLQKKIFYFDSYSNAVDLEMKDQSSSVNNENSKVKGGAKTFFNLPIAKSLMLLLSENCNGKIPVRAELVKISARIKPQKIERITLWGY